MATRALIVDDSATARFALRAALEGSAEIEVVGEATSGAEALARIHELRPDVVTLDVFLRGESGLDVAATIMSRSPVPIVAVTAADPTDPTILFRAMQAGVLEVCAKLPSPRHPDYAEQRGRLARTLRTLAKVTVVSRRHAEADVQRRRVQAPPAAPRRDRADDGALVGLGASTGGPQVLRQILRGLAGCPFPVAVVQHMVPSFLPGFAAWLADETGLRVVLVDRATHPEPGAVYLAAPDHHLQVGARGRLVPLAGPPVRHNRPSVDVLFESLASRGPRAAAVLLTGMGTDGVRGLAAVGAAGGLTIAQSPESCVVDGMPRTAIDRGSAKRVLEPEAIAAALLQAPSLAPQPHR